MSTEPRSNTPLAIALLALLIIALGVGGYFVQGKLKCDSLEKDYLESIEDMNRNATLGAIFPSDAASRKTRADLLEIQQRLVTMRLRLVYEKCGDEVGRRAAENGTYVLGS